MSTTASIEPIVAMLGNGTGLSIQDTIPFPFVLWRDGRKDTVRTSGLLVTIGDDSMFVICTGAC